MELVIKPFHSLPCELEVFTINGITANYRDFGNTFDHNEKARKPYGCGDMQFEPKPPIKEVLYGYNITEEEYYSICNELRCKLSVGSCRWCI